MVRNFTPEELNDLYLAAGEEVNQNIFSSVRRWDLLPPEEAEQKKASLIREDGQKLLNGFVYLRNLPLSAFGHKSPAYQNDDTTPRVEIITTVVGSYRGSNVSPLCIYLENDQCYVGYKEEEGIHSFGSAAETNFLTRVSRDKDGLWIENIMRAVMCESIKNSYSPRPVLAPGAQPK